MTADPLDPIGRVVKAQGLRGEIAVRPASDGSDVLGKVRALTLEHEGRRTAFEVRSARAQGNTFILALAGLSDRTAAEGWVGASVLLPRSQLPKAAEGEFYRHELIGRPVVTPQGDPVGTVVDLESAPGQEWLVVEGPQGRGLVPFAEKLVRVEADRLVADLPEGLFDLD
jgi:16S rRNA processing protein RimM